jgi:hypothetical protein
VNGRLLAVCVLAGASLLAAGCASGSQAHTSSNTTPPPSAPPRHATDRSIAAIVIDFLTGSLSIATTTSGSAPTARSQTLAAYKRVFVARRRRCG